ncbi:RHTO0S03e08130g1_1 [Rhodotorula toruloides]|uniref:RHTO0S03e08130g1_1 n=1 Tax=Rhodotorula toruloides TaxID=5286 RepID=A0A061AL41_RHOTO|nr:RHTO0S03e08130g1_1 [Rhodotorula toruloides]
MIALGGTIGTGLFVGAGGALATGGPLGIWLGYSIMGFTVGTMMVALGEMTTLYPVSARFLNPAAGFALGWNYWYSYAITLPTEITAAALVIQYWRDDINVAVWITVFLVVICCFNFLGVRAYGEAEFWFSLMKIITILGLILLGIIITASGVPGTDPIGFRFWRNPGPFQQENGIPGSKGRFLAFWTVLVQAAFSYLGTEIVALTAGEAENPRRNVPKAIRRVFYRILFFYVIGTFIMGLIVSPNDPNLTNANGVNASPWVIAIKNAGIKGLPSVINTVVLLSAFSAGNSDLYASSRTLYGLACDGKAPAIFRRCTKNGLPIYCLILTALVGLLAYMNVSTGSTTAFNYLSNLSSITGVITWLCVCVSYIRFYHGAKAHGLDRNDFPYKAPLQPWASYWGAFFFFMVIIFNGYTVFLSGQWSTANFIVSYITVVIFIVLFVFWKLFKRTKFVRIENMDFDTGRRELDQIAEDEAARYKAPTTWSRRRFSLPPLACSSASRASQRLQYDECIPPSLPHTLAKALIPPRQALLLLNGALLILIRRSPTATAPRPRTLKNTFTS